MWSTVSPAFTISMTRRGFFSELTSSSMRVRAHNLGALGFIVQEVVHLGHSAVEDGHAVAVVVHVEDQVLAHDGQTDQADITICVFQKSSWG